MIGDNRTMDQRWHDFGVRKREDILGKVIFENDPLPGADRILDQTLATARIAEIEASTLYLVLGILTIALLKSLP